MQQTEDKREKIQALSLAKECYAMKLDLITNATVVDDAIRFVTEKNNVVVNAEAKTRSVIIKEKQQQEQGDTTTTEQQHSTATSINQVF
jgi:hypothetical protein